MQYNRINQLMGKALTIFLLTIMTGTLFYLLEYPSLAYGDAYSDWVDGGSYDPTNSGNGTSDDTPHCDPSSHTEEECREGYDYCIRDVGTDSDCDTWENEWNCHKKVRGKCDYWGICIPRPCDTIKICTGTCAAPPNTCNPENGMQGGCVYTERFDRKGCVPVNAPDEPCTVDLCWRPKWVCDSVAQQCVYTIANTQFDANVHTNK